MPRDPDRNDTVFVCPHFFTAHGSVHSQTPLAGPKKETIDARNRQTETPERRINYRPNGKRYRYGCLGTLPLQWKRRKS